MKKQLLALCAAAAFVVGCDQQTDQGGVGTDTTIDRSTPSSATNYDSGSLTNTNRIDQPQTPPQTQTPAQAPSQPQQGAQPQQGTSPQ